MSCSLSIFGYLDGKCPNVSDHVSRVEPWLPYAFDAPSLDAQAMRRIRFENRTDFEHRVFEFLAAQGDCGPLMDGCAVRGPAFKVACYVDFDGGIDA